MTTLDDRSEQEPRTALVVGAAGSIGGAIAERLHDDGFRVVGADVSEDGLRELGGRFDLVPVVADIRTIAGVDSAVEAAGPRIDVLCTSMGVSDGGGSVEEIDDELWSRVLDVNLQSVFRLCRAVVPLMQAREAGVIINVASVAGLRGGRAGAAYTATKWAVVGLSQNIASTLGPEGIRCHAVCPSLIEGAKRMGAGVQRSPRAELRRNRDSQRPPAGLPSDVASVTSFLVSDAASHLNGLALPLDGGLLAY